MSRSYGGRAAEDRVAERRNRLVDAGVEVVGRGGVAALGMRAVCRQAGLSQKFFYESFSNIEALLHAVYAAALSRMEDAVAPAVSSGDLRGVFDAAARLMEADPRICRILLIEPLADVGLRRHVRATTPGIAVSALGGLIGGAPDDPLVRMRFSALFGALISLFVEWTEGNLGTDRRAFVDHVTEVAKQLVGPRSA
ncbi:TetR/AcrR family transcriptional regulator [Nocardia sp. CA-135398]|uniref:TetR/AcrR family transcriptional regulator n=1 Tax=Nocardia sp. CA-135398 TaxID=3239977 RepID=UPI003D96A9CB